MSIANIRVEVNKRYLDIYKQLIGQVTHYPKIFEQHADVFCLCVSLGFRTDRKTQNKGNDLFWSHSFNAEQVTVLKAVAVRASGNNYAILEQPEEIITLAEQYADGGMEILLEDVLVDFLRKDEGGSLSLDYNENSQLEKAILGFVQAELNKDPL